MHMNHTLYSKCWVATSGFNKFFQCLPKSHLISPHAPAICLSLSNAFHKAWIEVLVGRVPTSIKTQTLGLRILPKALKNQRWLLI